MIVPRPYQSEAVEAVYEHLRTKDNNPCVVLPTGCHAKDHPILMYDGTVRKVQDISVGDIIMGADSTPRHVLALARGREPMARITPIKGEPFVVNMNHILSLVSTNEGKGDFTCYQKGGEITNITVREYLTKSKSWRHLRKLYRVPVNFSIPKNLPIPPHILGLLLGDGIMTNAIGLTSAEEELGDEFSRYAESIGCSVRVTENDRNVPTYYAVVAKGAKNPLFEILHQLGLRGHCAHNKFIPKEYLTASRSDRLQLLAGLLDSDGFFDGHCLEITTQSRELAGDIVFLARSLGFMANCHEKYCACQTGAGGWYYRVHISGDLSPIPCRRKRHVFHVRQQKKNVLRTGFSVEILSEDDFYGFELDGDHLYVDGNFVVHHNTGKSLVLAQIAKDSVEKWNGRVLILAHVKELLEQNADKIRKLCPELKIGIYSAGLRSRDTTEQVIVAGIQSVYNKACELDAFDLVVVDEAHAISSEGDGMYRTFLADMKIINPHVRVIGLTATPFRLKGGLICKPENILNEICYEAGLKEMIQQGYLSPLISRAGRAEANLANLHIRGGEFISDEVAAAMDNEALVTSACREIVELTRDRKSVLIFTASVDHCKHVAEKIQAFSGKECAIVTGDTSPAERAEIIARFKGESISADLFGTPKPPLKFLANVNVLTTGFDAPNTDCVVMLRPTNSPGLLIQCAGRGTRLSPETGKTNCIAEGTMILTDRGLVPIEKVTTQMKLWDGIEYVPHGGIVFKGERNVIEYAGLTATPDHKVWSEHHWRTHGECAASGKPISCTGIEGKAVREADGYFRYGSCQGGVADSQTASAINAQTQVCIDAVSVRNGCMEVSGQSQKRHGWMPCLRQTAPCPEMAGCQDWKREGQMRESEQSPICGLRGTRNPVLLRRPDGYGTLADGALRLHGQEDANRQDRQQRKLRARQCEDDDSEHQWNEQEASAQSENASVQAGTSGSAICGRNALQSDFTGLQQRGDCRTVQLPVLQTKRRVWDILNAGPRHRFTANGLLVSNCLVLDYGGNILRHGPLDMIKVKEPGSGKGGDAPAKKCPQCLALIHAGYTACPECGYVFPPKESNDKMTQTASSAGVISGQVDYTDYEVLDVYYCVHEKRGADPDAPKTMRVDYQVGFNEFKSEWVCPEHTGYARGKFEKWWHERAALGCPMPRSAREAVSLANEGLLAAPESITVKTIAGERFERVTGFRLKERPVMREPGEDLEVGETWTSPAPPDDLDDDIPF